MQLDGSKSTDVDGNPLTFQWSLIAFPTGSHATVGDPTTVNPTFVADLPGTYIAQLIVNDGFNPSPPSMVTVTTSPVQAPTANAGLNQTVPAGSTVTLNGSGTDPQGLSLSFQWTWSSKPAGSAAAFSSSTVANPTFVTDQSGTYVARLVVSNGYLSSTPSTVTVSTTYTPPVAVTGPAQSVSVGTAVTLNGSGSYDSNQSQLIYKWSMSNPPGSNAVLQSANTASPTFTPDVAGMFVAQLIVNDGVSDSTPATVTITASSSLHHHLEPECLEFEHQRSRYADGYSWNTSGQRRAGG